MKISLNWAQYYSNVDLNKIGTEKLIEKIGAQLGAVEEVIEWGKRYDGAVVARVVECVKHPNADKLHVCKIDDGKTTEKVARDSKGLVEVVCGAPNVKAGMLVVWLPPGVTVPSSTTKDPFVLEARELRGVVSNGMLASSSELGLSDDHNGILEIDPNDIGNPVKPAVGMMLKALFALDDVIIDVENKMFTHRPDCFGILGVTRELAGIQKLGFKSPDWYLKPNPEFRILNSEELPLKVAVHDKKLVPRFMAVAVKGVRVDSSPIWLQSYLARVGIRPINNIVDLTNYYMYLTAQPLHAYDYDKLGGNLETRLSKKGEKLKLLNGKEITFEDDSTVLITSKDKPVGVGGVMGGSETEVDENTKNIVIECANFDMYNIRRTSMKYGLFTDAVTRFNKGQSPLQNDRVVAHIMDDIFRIAGGEQASKVHDIHSTLNEPGSVTVTAQFINERLGLNLSLKEIAKLLENVEFTIKTVPADKNRLHIKPPFWRTDIEIPEDIVEEVGRLYGYDHLPLVLPQRDITPAPKDELLEIKAKIRDILSDAGANEVLTYSFVHGNLLEKAGQDKKEAFQLSNALSPDLQYYRLSLTPSLLDKVHPNIKAGYDEFALFEIGKSHNKTHSVSDGVPDEFEMTALTYASKNGSSAAYYQARKFLDYLGRRLGLIFSYVPITDKPDYAVTKPFDIKRSAYVMEQKTGAFIGIIGEYTATVRRNLKLPLASAGFELGTEDILKAVRATNEKGYEPLPKFPKVEQDISLKTPIKVSYQELYNFVFEQVNEQKPENTRATLAPVDIYQQDDKDTHKNITLRLNIAAFNRTLKAEEVNTLLDEVATAAHEKFGAERI